MALKPLHDRILVQAIEGEQKTAGGIIIPDSAQEKPVQGKVIAVGSGARKDDGTVIPMDLKEGDTVIYGKWSGTEVRVDGQEMLMMRESDVYGVLD